MGLKALDGFDHYNTVTDMNARRGFLQYGNLGGSFVGGRFGGKAFEIAFFVAATFGQRVAEAGIGLACNSSSIGDFQGEYHFHFDDTVANATQITVQFNQINGTILIYRGQEPPFSGTLLYTSPNNTFMHSARVWMYVEIWLKIDNAAGYVDVWIDGQRVVHLTGIDSQNTANAWWDSIGQIRETNGLQLWIDDLYYCDTSVDAGPNPNNAPLGDVRVATLFAIGNDAVQWTPAPNTNANWQNIDETAMDSDTTYNFSDTIGQEDRFNFNPLPNVVSAIYGLQVTGAYRKDDAGAREIKQLVRTGGSTYYGADFALPDTSYQYWSDLWINNPNSGTAWTNTDLNAIVAGYNMVA